MPKFRQKPSSRREASPVAKWLVVGYDTSREILHKGRSAYILPVRSSDHRKRYAEGRQLAVKAFVGGPTECRVNVTRVDRLQVEDVDFETARALGYVRVDAFREDWTRPQQWVWVVWFDLDRTETPRMLAQAGRDRGSFYLGADKRHHYRESAEDGEADRGYTSTDSLSLRDEPRALTDDEWERHVDRNRDRTHEEWVALKRAEKQRRLPKHLRRAA